MNWTKIKRAALWLFWNTVILCIAWFAVHGVPGAQRVLAFWMWWHAFTNFLLTYHRDHAEVVKLRAKGRSVPEGLGTLVDWVLACFLIWFGFGWTAAAVLLGWMGSLGLDRNPATSTADPATT